MHTPTLYAACRICEEFSSDDVLYPLRDLRMTPDDGAYCEECWNDSQYNEPGAWEAAETLQHLIDARHDDLLAALKAARKTLDELHGETLAHQSATRFFIGTTIAVVDAAIAKAEAR